MNRTLGAVLLFAFWLGSQSVSWARLPQPVHVTGVVAEVDARSRRLSLQVEGSAGLLLLEWNTRTIFRVGGTNAGPQALCIGSRLAVTYKPVSFRHPILKEVRDCPKEEAQSARAVRAPR